MTGTRSRPTRCPPCWRGWPTRACWSRRRPRSAPATACSRRSGSTAPRCSTDAGEADAARARHLHWCLAAAERLGEPGLPGTDGDTWRAGFDEVSLEVRRCLPWARHVPEEQATAYRLSLLTAGLSLLRGRPGEAQRRFELAAELAPDDAAATFALRQAAGAADGRQFGNESLRLREMAADAALRAGDPAGAAMDLARAAELVGRGPGIMAVPPPAGEAERLLSRARPLADGLPAVQSRILTAEAFALGELDPQASALVDRALLLAQRARDPLAESAALDALTSIQLAGGRLREALDSAVRRTELLASVPVTAESALEFFDAYQMGSQCALAAGDLGEACRLGEGLLDLPFYREEYHLGTSRLIVVGLLAGTWDEAHGTVRAVPHRVGARGATTPGQPAHRPVRRRDDQRPAGRRRRSGRSGRQWSPRWCRR